MVGEMINLLTIEYNILLLLRYLLMRYMEQIWDEEAIGADNTVAVHIHI